MARTTAWSPRSRWWRMDRLYGAMRLNPAAFEAAENDPDALPQAFGIVVIFAVAAGTALAGPERSLASLAVAIAGALAGWISWATLVCSLGVRVFPEPQTRADVGQLARSLGFSAAPGVWLVVAGMPMPRPVAWAIVAGVGVWMAAAMVIAVRQALDFTHTRRAVAVCAAGLALTTLIVLGIGLAFGTRVS